MDIQTAAASSVTNGCQQAGYAELGDLRLYYEIHGEVHAVGTPLVLLHGGFMNIYAMGPLLSLLSQSRQVIAVDLEGHGRTNHPNRPLHYTQMADDVGGLLRGLSIAQADIFGFSMGGMTALRLAMRHPQLVHKLVVVSSPYSNEGYYRSVSAAWPSMSVARFRGTPMEQGFQQLAPEPQSWPLFIEKMKEMMVGFEGWSAEEVAEIGAPTLLIVGDADTVRLEHTIEMFRLLGGERESSGMDEHPAAQLAVLPNTKHFNILYRTDLLLGIVLPFLNGERAPQPFQL